MTPGKLRELADGIDAQALAALDRGDREEARRLFIRAEDYRVTAEEMERLLAERLPPAMTRGNDISVTQTEKRRVRAIAATKAQGKSELHRAIVARWGSLTAAARALRISQPLLSQALSGVRAVPPHVRERVRAETGREDWPARQS